MILHTARFIQNITQADIWRECGVVQPVLSLFEKSRIDNINDEQKKKIENYLQMKIDWSTEEESDPLSKRELKDLKFFVEQIRKGNDNKKVNRWLSNFKTSRQTYIETKKIINKSRIRIPILEMKWNKNGTPNYDDLKDD